MAMSREICKLCHRVNPVGFAVSDQTWKVVVPEHVVDKVVCLSCFVRLADEKMIFWDLDIEFFPVSLMSHYEFMRR